MDSGGPFPRRVTFDQTAGYATFFAKLGGTSLKHAAIGRRAFLRQAGIYAGALAIAPLAKGQENEVRPAPNMPAPNMPAPKFIDTNGIRMAVYEQGAGKPIVFSHGFPELAYSWRNQIKALSGAGYRAIAPDQRGYGLTDRPEAMESYDLKHLCDDMAGMLDALGIDKAVFCGHDWGGGVVWSMVRLHPERYGSNLSSQAKCSKTKDFRLPDRPSDHRRSRSQASYGYESTATRGCGYHKRLHCQYRKLGAESFDPTPSCMARRPGIPRL